MRSLQILPKFRKHALCGPSAGGWGHALVYTNLPRTDLTYSP